MTTTVHHFNDYVCNNYDVKGHIKGNPIKYNGLIVKKNHIWIVNDKDDGELFLMFVEPNILCKLCHSSYQKILDFEKYHKNGKKLTWLKKHNTNYIRAEFNYSCVYIHQIIMDHYGHGSGTSSLSVDHINRDPTDNRLKNLRIVNCDVQQQNAKGIVPDTKRERRYDAICLPNGIVQENLPKYVTYTVNKYGKYNEYSREYFRIESHPALKGSIWSSTSKKSVSIEEKLSQTIDALKYLDANNILPEKPERDLPHYVSAYDDKGSHLIAWRKNESDQILTKKITISDDYYELNKNTQQKELNRLNKEIVKKYGIQYAFCEISPEEYQIIQNEKNEEMPQYVRKQEFHDGLYLVFNKNKGEQRLSTTVKLPLNYNINKELHLFDKKITDKFGEEHSIVLNDYPYNENDEKHKITIPKNVYVSLHCKKPYIFIKDNDNQTRSMELPDKYDLQEQIDLFLRTENQTPDPLLDIEQVKTQLYDNGKKPTNISVVFKDKKYHQLQYKVKTKEIKHDKAMTLPKSSFNINVELVKMNDIIVGKYGAEYSLFG